MMKSKLITILCCLSISLMASAQSQSSMRLNEVLIENTTDFQDDFGQHSPWFELFNTSYGTVDIGGCFITDDPANLKKYIIPKGDIMTKIKPRQHILFWGDGQPFRGTFHTNFVLEGGKEIIFVSSDGRTIIDRIKIPAALEENMSYGRKDDGIGSNDGSGEGWQVMGWTSPSTNNSGVDAETKSMIMKKQDPYGWIMAVTAMSVVFLALILLYRIFKRIGTISIKRANKKAAVVKNTSVAEESLTGEVSGETYAAIAMALHLFEAENDAHDQESFVVTLHHTDRRYSPWSSKIYSLRQTPQIKQNK